MNITSMSISNFKGIKDEIKIDFKPVTLLFGPNSAGKSTIIQALHYAWEVISRHNLNPKSTEFGGQAVDFGGFENLVYGHDKNNSITLRFDIDLKNKKLIEYLDEELKDYRDHEPFRDEPQTNIYRWNLTEPTYIHPSKLKSTSVEITIAWDSIFRKFRVFSYKIFFNNEIIGSMKTNQGEEKAIINYINFCHPLLCIERDTQSYFHDFGELCSKLFMDSPNWLDFSIVPEKEYELLKNFVEKFNEVKKKCIDTKFKYDETEKRYKEADRNYHEAIKAELSDEIEEGNYKFKEKLYECKSALVECYEALKEYNEALKEYNESLHKNNELETIISKYEFWLYCREIFNFKALNDYISIECLGQSDAIPDFNNLLDIEKSEIDFVELFKEEYLLGDLATYLVFPAIKLALSQFFLAPQKLLKDELEKLLYIGPIRSRIPRNYEPDSIVDNRKWADGIASWDVLYNADQSFLDKLNYWMEERLHTGYILEKQTDSNLQIVCKNNQIKLRPIDIGVGISQVLPIIVASLYAKEGLVAVEQPELHIHPAYQVELGDLFLSQALNNNMVFLIETHSEHLLLRILKRVRETNENELKEPNLSKILPEDIGVYFIESAQDGTKATKISIDEDGDFKDSWPQGFFEERLQEWM